MAAEFDLFQAPPGGEAAPAAPAREEGDLDLFGRPPGGAPARAEAPAPSRAPSPPAQRGGDDLDLFARPPGVPARPSAPAPAPEAPAAPADVDLFGRPPGAPQRAPSAPPAAPAPAAPEAPAAPAPGRGRGRGRGRERADFEGEDLWQTFLDEKYQGGRSLVEHPDPVQRRRRRNRAEPRVRFNTAMRYDNFRTAVGREYEAWKQQRQQAQQPAQAPAGRLEVGGRVQNLDQLSDGMVLKRSGPGGDETIRIVSTRGDTVRYQWKKEDGSWSSRTRSSGGSSFIDRGYTLQRRETDESEGPRAPVGEAIQSADRLRVGDVIHSSPGRERRILSIDGDQIKTQKIDQDGNDIGDPQTFSIQTLARHKMVEHADEGPRVDVGANIDDTDQLRAGDFIENQHLADQGIVRKILEVLPNGDIRTQRISTRNGRPVGSPQEISRAQVQRTGGFSHYGQYKRVENPSQGESARAERERQEREQRERQEREERERALAQEREEQPHVGIGDPIEHPRALRVGDTFRNSYLEGMNQHREVTEIRPNGDVMTRLVDATGRAVSSPEPFRASAIRQYGPYKRFLGPGQPISSPEDVGPGSYVKKGDKLYRVVHRTATGFEVQDVHQGRGVGRPTKVRKADLEDGDYMIAATPRRAETGERVTSFNRLREGQVVKAMHHRTPKWVRVESIGEKLKIQPLNPDTGEPEGEPEELSKSDLKRWAYLTKTGNLPEALLPPLVEPPGGFAPAGQGDLTPNKQPGRYDDVSIRLAGGATEDTLRRLLNLPEDGPDPLHVIADLAGAGGLAKSLSSITISVSTYRGNTEISVGGSGEHIMNMSRSIYFENGEPSRIYNAHFRLSSGAPKGMGLKMFATQVASAREHGFKYVSVSAAGSGPWRDGQYNGYYVWPRFGYDGAFSSYTFSRMPRHIQDKIKEIRPGAPQGLRFLDVMMAGKEARDWWKDNGDSAELKFKLGPRSRSYQYLTQYVREVAQKDADVGADQFLNRAAAKKEKHEWYPAFGPEEEKISDEIWDRMGEKVREKNEKKGRKKKAALHLVDLAGHDPNFRKLLLSELSKGRK